MKGEPDGGIRRVDALTARSARAEGVDPQILLVDLDIHLFGLRQHGHRGRRGVDASARFGRRHALHAVHAALVLEPAVHAASFDRGDDFLEPADAGVARRHHLEPPALTLGELRIHAEQLAGEERRFVAAGAGADFEDDVLRVVRILRHEHHLELGQQAVAAGEQRLQLFARQLAHVGVGAGGELLGLRDLAGNRLVFAEALDERFHLGERLGVLAVFGRIALHLVVPRSCAALRSAVLPRQFVEHKTRSPSVQVR